eukprot:TRINITY_DN5772_c3_g1_i1.p1 TRINITY_DN5772_c3_g1~~TRINITY_DN5772_c3_g1_i1.p1  ORF type:complete len:143 (+),score=1.51 TRINITY_DN5772_c3_g1_i1:81-509(+)
MNATQLKCTSTVFQGNETLSCDRPFGDLHESYICYSKLLRGDGWGEYCEGQGCYEAQCWCSSDVRKCYTLIFSLAAIGLSSVLFLWLWFSYRQGRRVTALYQPARMQYAPLPATPTGPPDPLENQDHLASPSIQISTDVELS